jgi:membrane-bound inhibitor of C-type lysozyme
LALMSGCSPDEPDVAAVVPEPLAPEPQLAPEPLVEVDLNQAVINVVRPSQAEFSGIREGVPPGGAVQVDRAAQVEVQNSPVPQTPLRLVFECTDGVTFAVRMNDSQLRLYPPGYPPNGSLTLTQVPSASGAHYRAGDIDFRSKGDVATLEMGRERYVDCVANPAAATWQDPLTLNSEPLEQRLRAVEQPR